MNLESNKIRNWTVNEVVSNTEQISSYVDGRIDKIKKIIDNQDYTAFEVFPTTIEIPANTVDSLEGLGQLFGWDTSDTEIQKQNFSGETYTIKVPAENKCVIYLETYVKEGNDIVIDWGDGTDLFVVNDQDYSAIPADTPENANIDGIRYFDDDIEHSLVIQHTYSEEQSNRKHIVKIYGKDYYTLRPWNLYSLAPNNIFKYGTRENLCSRILDRDLPLARNLKNLSSALAGGLENNNEHRSLRLLKLSIPGYYDMKSVINLCYFCNYAENLKKVKIPASVTFNKQRTIAQMFKDCINLESNVEDICNMFTYVEANPIMVFMNCPKLKGTPPAKLLWENPNFQYSSTNNAFTGCSDELRAKVPTSWGGTKRDNYLYLKTVDGTWIGILDNKIRFNHKYDKGMEIKVVITDENKEVTLYGMRTEDNTPFYIDWGDGSLEEHDGEPTKLFDKSHTYENNGEYTIQISDKLERIAFNKETAPSTFADNLTIKEITFNTEKVEVIQYGCMAKLSNLVAVKCTGSQPSKMFYDGNTTTGIFGAAYITPNLVDASGFRNLTEIAEWSFRKCTSLKSIEFDNKINWIASTPGSKDTLFLDNVIEDITFNAMTASEIKTIPVRRDSTITGFPWRLADSVRVHCLSEDRSQMIDTTIGDIKNM